MHAIKHITYTHQTPALNSSLEGVEEGPYNTIKDLNWYYKGDHLSFFTNQDK